MTIINTCKEQMDTVTGPMYVHPITLKFLDSKLEEEFGKDRFKNSILSIRISLLFWISLYSLLFMMTDFKYAEHIRDIRILMRIFILISGIGIFLFTFKSWFHKYYQPLVLTIATIGICSIPIMMAFSFDVSQKIVENHYVGMILLFMSVFAFSRIRFIYSISICILSLILYQFAAFHINLSHTQLFDNNIYLITGTLIACFLSYSFEYCVRQNFFILYNSYNTTNTNSKSSPKIDEIRESMSRVEVIADQLASLGQENDKIKSELRKSTKMFSDLYNQAPDMYFTVSFDGKIISVNEFGAHHLGYDVDELVDRVVWDIVYPDDLERTKQQINKLLTGQDPGEIIFRKLTKNNDIIWVHERVKLITNDDGSVKELWINCRDITELKEIENKLKRSEYRYSTLFEHCHEGICIIKDFKFIKINSRVSDIFGWDKNEILGEVFTKFVHPEDQECVMVNLIRNSNSNGSFDSYECRIVTKDEKVTWVYLNIVVMNWESDDDRAMVIFLSDITQLKIKQLQYKVLFDNAQEGICVWYKNKAILFNDAFCSISGWSRSDLEKKSKKLIDLVHPSDKHFVLNNYKRRLDGRSVIDRFPFRLIASGHFVKWMFAGVVKIPWEDSFATLAFLQDITSLKLTEYELAERRNLLYQIIDALPFPVMYKSLDGVYKIVNRAFSRMVGLPIADIIGKTELEVNSDFSKECVARDNQLMSLQKCIKHKSEMMWIEDKEKAHSMIIYRIPHFYMKKLVGIIIFAIDESNIEKIIHTEDLKED